MKVKNGTLKEGEEALRQLLGLKLPISTAFKLARMGTIWQPRLQAIRQSHQGIIEKYAVKDEKTGRNKTKKGEDGVEKLDLTPEAEALLVKDYEDLMDIEEEMAVQKVQIASKWDGKTLEVEAKYLMPLLDFVEVVDG